MGWLEPHHGEKFISRITAGFTAVLRAMLECFPLEITFHKTVRLKKKDRMTVVSFMQSFNPLS